MPWCCLQGFANLTIGAKLAQLLHQATTKITPKIRRKPAGRAPRPHNRKPQPPHGEGEDMDNDPELDNLLESSFLDAVSEDEAPPGGAIIPALPDDTREEGECSSSEEDASGDDSMAGMGLGFGMDFADVTNDAQQDEAFAEAVVPGKLPPAAKKAMERDRARRRRRHLAEKGWDAFQVLFALCNTRTLESGRYCLPCVTTGVVAVWQVLFTLWNNSIWSLAGSVCLV